MAASRNPTVSEFDSRVCQNGFAIGELGLLPYAQIQTFALQSSVTRPVVDIWPWVKTNGTILG